MSLVSWLREQVAEDERVARGVPTDSRGNVWTWSPDGETAVAIVTNAIPAGESVTIPRPPFDPARVLAECEAKRRIIEAHHAELMDVVDGVEHWTDCADCRQGPPCHTLRLLALPYADRPGYQERWRP